LGATLETLPGSVRSVKLPDPAPLAVMARTTADNAAPAIASLLIYIVMALVLFFKPQGLFPPRTR